MNTLKAADKDGNLIIVSEGRSIASAEDVVERLREGATLTTTSEPFFLRAGPCALYDIKSGLLEHMLREQESSKKES